MSDILYWREIIGESDLLSTFATEIEQLAAGEYKSLDLEKLRGVSGTPIYSIRVNKETRLLFTTYKGKLYLLDVVANHDYHKNRYLRNPGLLNSFFAKLDASIEFRWGEKLSLEALSAEEKEDLKKRLPPKKEKSRFVALDYYKENFIGLSAQQEQALQAKLPALVYGPAGSGKTCVAFFALHDYVKRRMQKDTSPVLYVSRSATLVAEMKAQWKGSVDEKLQDCVSFLTYEELFNNHCTDKKKPLADTGLFQDWFAKTIKQAAYKGLNTLTAETVWLEFRIRSGYSEEDYIHLGTRQSSLDEGQRQMVCKLYNAFLSHYMASELTPLSPTKSYPMILVDEAQDFSFAQLESLYTLADKGNIVYFLGDHQILFDGKSRLPFLRQLFHKKEQPYSEHQLPASYRCPASIVNVTNQLIQLKYQVTGGAADKVELGHIISAKEEQDNGELLWLATNSKKDLEALQQEATQSAKFALVAFPEFIEEARKTFKTPLIFTPEQIKGLEYDTILFWRPFDGKDGAAACSKLKEKQGTVHTTSHLPKTGEGDESCLPYFNRFITGITRAKRKLIIVQNKEHRSEALYDALKPAFTQENKQAASPQSIPVHQSTTQDWEAEARKLLQQGNETQARDIFLGVLGRNMEQFKAFQKVTTTPLHNHLPTDKKINKEEGNTTEKGGNSQEEPQSQGRKKKKKLQPSSPLQHLMNNFSEKQLIATLSTCPFEEILLQATAVPHQVPKKSQTLLEFILSDRNRTQLFLKQIANDYKLTENFIRSYAKILDFYNKLPSSKLSGKKLFDQFCRLIHKTLKFEIINNSNLVHLAALLGDIEHFDLLHKLGANFDIANSYGLTPLYVAVSYGHITLIDKFYQYKADFNKATNAGGTPAIAAAYKGNANMIKKLHERGANLNKADSAGITPAIVAAELGHVDVIEILHQLGGDLDKETSDGTTATYIAAQNGRLDAIIKLHECKADFHKARTTGATPLFIAVQNGHFHVAAKLCEYGADPNVSLISSRLTPIYIAAQKGRIDLINKLVEYGADLNMPNLRGDTPAFTAAYNGHVNVIGKLYEYGADLNQSNNDGVTPLYAAAEKGNVDVIIKLHECKADLHKARATGATPVYIAAQMGHAKVVSILCEYGADPNRPIITGATPVFIAAKNGHLEVIKLFSQWNGDLNKADDQGITPAYVAAENDHANVVEILYLLGADLNKGTKNDTTPAYIAAEKGHVNVLIKLRQYGADFNKPTKIGTTPACIAAQNGHVGALEELYKGGADFNKADARGVTPAYIAAYQRDIAVLEKLNQYGVDLNKAKAGGYTPVYVAAENGHVDVLIKLHEYKADFNKPSVTGATPAYVAATLGRAEVLATLSKCGADFNKANIDGTTPILIAAQKGYAGAIEQLCLGGANLDLPNSQGLTPVHLAAACGHAAAVEMLYKFGSDLGKPNAKGLTPIILAAKNGHAAVIKKFHECKFDVNESNKQGVTPAFLATYFGHVAVLEQLHECGINLDKTAPKGVPLAITAATRGHVSIIEKLHEYGADLNKAGTNGLTPVFAAVQHGHIDVIKKLYDCGANFENLNSNKETVIHVAIKNRKLDVLTTLHGLNINWDKTLNGITPAHIAIQQGNIDFIKSMFDKNIKFNIPYVTNKSELEKLIQSCIKKKDATHQQTTLARLQVFIERQESTEDKLSISPLELAKIINRQDIIELLKRHETQYHQSYSFFALKEMVSTNEIFSKLEL